MEQQILQQQQDGVEVPPKAARGAHRSSIGYKARRRTGSGDQAGRIHVVHKSKGVSVQFCAHIIEISRQVYTRA